MCQDFDTWVSCRKPYLPSEYHGIYSIIDHHCEKYHKMPSIEELKLEIRDGSTREKLFAIDGVDVDSEPFTLLEYLKNEYAQRIILDSLDEYVDKSVAFADADESVNELHQIVLDVEDKVELEKPQDSMQRITLFEDDEELGNYLSLGLNTEYDHEIQFSPRDLILVGGKRGAGKSVVCSNIANNVFSINTVVLKAFKTEPTHYII